MGFQKMINSHDVQLVNCLLTRARVVVSFAMLEGGRNVTPSNSKVKEDWKDA